MQIENLSAYEPETDAILQWCADWLGQDAYDDLARMHDLTVMPVYHAYKGTDYLLPSLAGNPAGRRGDWIFLVQALADKGLVEVREQDGKVQYRTRPEAVRRMVEGSA